MFRRVTMLFVVLCLIAVSCGGSSAGNPAGDVDPPVGDTTATDPGGCPALTEVEAIDRARSIAEADDMGDIADGFLNSAGVVTAANIREDFWEVTFTTDGGAIEIYLTCNGELASVATNGDALP